MGRDRARLRKFSQSPTLKPNLGLGLRATLSCIPPLLVAALYHQPALSWMALGGLYVNLADVGGAYRTKASTMLISTLVGAVSLGLAVWIGNSPWLSIPGMLIWGFSCGLLNLYGNSGTMIGLVVVWCFLIGLGFANPDLSTALNIALCYLAGGLWGTVLALGFWPLHAYQPVRVAINHCYQAIAQFMQIACPPIPKGGVDELDLYQQKLRVRDALTTSRTTLADTRGSRLGSSPTDEGLTVLIESADRLYLTTAALGDLYTTSDKTYLPQLWEQVDDLNARCVTVLSQLGMALGNRTRIPDLEALQAKVHDLKQQLLTARNRDQAVPQNYQHLLALTYVVATLEQWISYGTVACKAIPAASFRKPAFSFHPSSWPRSLLETVSSWKTLLSQGWLTLTANFTPASTVFRHAVRYGITTAIAVSIYTLFNLPMGYWITLTVSVILKPYAGDTFQRTMQRVTGTTMGGVLGIVLVSLVTQPLLLVLIMAPITLGMLAVLQVNYGIFVFLLTPWVVLYENIVHPGVWEFGLWRICNTLIGAVLALAANALILPRWEHQQLPSQLAATLRTNCHYFQAVFAIYLGSITEIVPFSRVNQQVRLAMNNTHASFQRFLNEGRRTSEQIEPLMTLIIYNQRFIDTLVLLQNHTQQLQGKSPLPGLEPFIQELVALLTNLAEAIEQHQIPEPLPDLRPLQTNLHAYLHQLHTRRMAELAEQQNQTPLRETVFDHSLLGQQIERLMRQVTVMHGAIARLSHLPTPNSRSQFA